jgi:hypothetical protein
MISEAVVKRQGVLTYFANNMSIIIVYSNVNDSWLI